MILVFVYSEVNLSFAHMDTWWVDSGATTHIVLLCRVASGANHQVMLKDSSMWRMIIKLQWKL